MLRTRSGSEPRNRLLASLPHDVYARMTPHLARVELERRSVLHAPGARIDRVYFPETLIASIVQPTRNDAAFETAMIGFEGLVGLTLLFGVESSNSRALVQIPGVALVMSSAAFRGLIAEPTVRDQVGRYAAAYLAQLSQGAACGAAHSVRQRCARWLLEAHDRARGEAFEITHALLARTIGVRRASVTEVALALQNEGLIQYRYGHVQVANRAGLEGAACECYAQIAGEYARIAAGREVAA